MAGREIIEQLSKAIRDSSESAFEIVSSQPAAHGSIFGFSEFLAAVALFLVLLTTSDYRYRFRLALASRNFRLIGFWLVALVGSVTLIIDVWYQNYLPTFAIILNPNNAKVAMGTILLIYVLYGLFVTNVMPVVFNRRNAQRFFLVNYHAIHQGDPDKLQVVAEELERSISPILGFATGAYQSQLDRRLALRTRQQPRRHEILAHNLLLLLADRRFCKTVVDRHPSFAIKYFETAKKDRKTPSFQFCRNVGQEFILNEQSAFYQEESSFYSGYVGAIQPTTKSLFGDYEFIEWCASEGSSPLDTDYLPLYSLSPTQLSGFSRAALAFTENYLTKTRGKLRPHSYALTRMLHAWENVALGIHKLEYSDHYSEEASYQRIKIAVKFAKDLRQQVEKKGIYTRSFTYKSHFDGDIFDKLADLFFELILSASMVSSERWVTWAVQNNAVWGPLFNFSDSHVSKVVSIKVRRLIFNEIKNMDTFPNFKGARLLALCLNVLGVKPLDRIESHNKEWYPLQILAIEWVRKNFKNLLVDHPKVAAACLAGTVSYDQREHRLVKTFRGDTQKEPTRHYLVLD